MRKSFRMSYNISFFLFLLVLFFCSFFLKFLHVRITTNCNSIKNILISKGQMRQSKHHTSCQRTTHKNWIIIMQKSFNYFHSRTLSMCMFFFFSLLTVCVWGADFETFNYPANGNRPQKLVSTNATICKQ